MSQHALDSDRRRLFDHPLKTVANPSSSNTTQPPSIILLGGGGHCRSVIDVILASGCFGIAGVVENPSADRRDEVLGLPVLGSDDDLPELRKRFHHALVTVGQIKSAVARVRLYETLLSLGFEMPVIISPHAYVSPHAVVGSGTVVMHGAIVNAGASIGCNCIVNSRALIEHDAEVGSHCHISTGAILNGQVRVGAETFIGSATTVREGIVIPAQSVIGMGSCLRKMP